MTMVTLLVVMLLAGAVARSLVGALRHSRRQLEEAQAQWLAEAALARGLARLRTAPEFAGETWRPNIAADQTGVAEIRVQRGEAGSAAALVVEARYPDHPWQRASVTRRYSLPQPQAAP